MAVVGAGQAGLAMSHELTGREVEHVVLERGEIGQTWRGRWNSFCLVTPNWTIRLPGGAYDGNDPDGYLPRDQIVAHLERYATSFGAPVRARVAVEAVDADDTGFRITTSDGTLEARAVILASGAYQRPHRPAALASLPPELPVLDVDAYRDEVSLPAGRVLIVGSGQSGCQIAEELVEAGREVVIACGRAPWVTRRIADRDVVWWGVENGFIDMPLGALPDPSARLWSNLLTTGHHGGHDLHLRTLDAMAGVTLAGHLEGVDGWTAHMADDLASSLAWGDERYLQFMGLVHRLADARGMERPALAPMPPLMGEAPTTVDLRTIGVVLCSSGFRPDYGAMLPTPAAVDGAGFPIHDGSGSSTVVPGLHFVGVHFLRTRKSSLLFGVGEDAALVAERVADDLRAA